MDTSTTARPGKVIIMDDNPQVMWSASGEPVYVKYQAKYKVGYILCSGLFFGLPGIAVYCFYKYNHGKKKDARLRRDFEARYAPGAVAYVQPEIADDYPPPFVSHRSSDSFIYPSGNKNTKS
ncbi:hypothetical protein DIURU_000657 [Diutina rugosa]|uniref:Uncharacterized protein n=1 Tax=Diutina rugosa TaxID=5481 RepID=A0A642V1E3_DIURU|nr:uncharacterized protein DIURU_000657 [Diutina rugosa]KAA8906973.1 hypothetical protein DIURU_000657 [Diutina rugosa]